jgi:hypothetical protein
MSVEMTFDHDKPSVIALAAHIATVISANPPAMTSKAHPGDRTNEPRVTACLCQR